MSGPVTSGLGISGFTATKEVSTVRKISVTENLSDKPVVQPSSTAPHHEETPAPLAKTGSEASKDVKEAFKDTKEFARNLGTVLKDIHNEFSATDSLKDAFTTKGPDGKVSLAVPFRSTVDSAKSAFSAIETHGNKAVDTIKSGTGKALNAIHNADSLNITKTITGTVGALSWIKNKATDLMKKVDDTIKDKPTDSFKTSALKSIGRFFAKAAITIGAVAMGVAEVATRVVMATVQTAVKAVAFTGTVVGSAIAKGAVRLGQITAGAVVGATALAAGALETVGRAVVAPALNLVGKIGIGAVAAVGGTLGIVAHATKLVDLKNAIGDTKLVQGAKNLFKGQGQKDMEALEKLMDKAGIPKSSIDQEQAKVKTKRFEAEGYKDGKLGIKGTVARWYKIAMGKMDTASTAVSGALGASGMTAGQISKAAISVTNVSANAAHATQYIGMASGVVTAAGGAAMIGKSSYDTYQATKMKTKISDFKDPQKMADRLEKKAEKLIEEAKGVRAGGIITKADPEKADKMLERAAALKKDAAEIRTMPALTDEMKNIADQLGNRTGRKMKVVGIVKGSAALAGGVVTAVAAKAAITVGAAVLLSNPAGLALTGVVVGITACAVAYKINKTLTRENFNDRLQAQQKLIEDKLQANPGNADLQKALEGVKTLRAKKDPVFAAERLKEKINSNPTTPAGIKEKQEAIQFVKHVLKIDPASLTKPTATEDLQTKIPIYSGLGRNHVEASWNN